MMQPFPEWQQTLGRDDVLAILLDLQNQGHSIVFGRPPAVDGWTILGGSPTQWVAVRPGSSERAWSVCVGNLGRSMGQVYSRGDLRGYLNVAMRVQGMDVSNPPTQVSVESSEPAGNMAKLVAIIGSATVEALWDAYLTNETLSCLVDIRSLGVKLDSSIRILAGDQEVVHMLKQGRLTDTFFSQFRQQVSKSAEIRLCAKEHDRLIFL